MDFQTKKELYNRCKPDEPLDPSDPRCVDIDARDLRGQVWANRLATQFLLEESPVRLLFSGLSGSGKSTELRRLRRVLERDAPDHRVVMVDAAQHLDLQVPVEAVDILAIVLDAVDKDLRSIEGAPGESLMRRFWDFFQRIRADEVSFESPAGSARITRTESGSEIEAQIGHADFALGTKLRTDPGARQWIRDRVASAPSAFFEQVQESGAALVERAKKLDYEGIIVLVDSLEKLRGMNDSWEAVYNSVVRLFGEGAPFLALPFHVLYTVPPTLKARIRDIEFLPAVRLRERSGERNADGFDAMKKIVDLRIGSPLQDEILGPEREARLDKIFEISGGYPREIIRILRELVSAPSLPVSGDQFEKILSEVRTTYRSLVPEGAFDWLVRVQQARFLIHESDEEIELVARMLGAEVVLCYHNHEEWWALHPAVAQIPGVAERLAGGG